MRVYIVCGVMQQRNSVMRVYIVCGVMQPRNSVMRVYIVCGMMQQRNSAEEQRVRVDTELVEALAKQADAIATQVSPAAGYLALLLPGYFTSTALKYCFALQSTVFKC
jgi:hypothetical protein